MRGHLAVAGMALLSVLGSVSVADATTIPPIRHVFIIVLENESASTTFAPNSPAKYLSQTLRVQGAFVPNYYGTGHESNDNYISMISGQPPNPDNQADCQMFGDFPLASTGAYGQQEGAGCVYPSGIQTIAGQLGAAGLTWRDYNESMGADPAREAGVCAHPGVGQGDGTQSAKANDMYATRHNPFVYFHSVIDDTTLCDTHVVNLDLLPGDLLSAASTPNYVFITPNLCDDGHDAKCADGEVGGLTGADRFLREWVPQITASPAFRYENGLLMIIFDEAAASNASACCGEIAGPGSPMPGIEGPGGGDTGAVFLSPCIAPGTVTKTAYNHYTMLRSVEDIFGVPRLGYAQLPGGTSFGPDIFTRSCRVAPLARVRAPAIASATATRPRVRIGWSATIPTSTFTVEVRRTSGPGRGPWRTLRAATSDSGLSFRGSPGQTYQFRVRALDTLGLTSPWASRTVVVPTTDRPSGARLNGIWRAVALRGAWLGRALVGAGGSKLAYSWGGGSVSLIAARSRAGGRALVTVDGRPATINLYSAVRHARVVVFSRRLALGRHRLRITVLGGAFALEGLGITNLR